MGGLALEVHCEGSGGACEGWGGMREWSRGGRCVLVMCASVLVYVDCFGSRGLIGAYFHGWSKWSIYETLFLWTSMGRTAKLSQVEDSIDVNE